MKVRIIKNAPTNPQASSIERFVGKVYNAESMAGTDNVSVEFGLEVGTMTVYPDEYEIIDIKDDLDNYFRKDQHKYNFCNDDVVDFIMEHRDEIVKILR